MVDELPGVISNGGPLIAIPRDLVDSWQGALPEGAVRDCDYERACDPPDERVTISDSYSTWMVSVGGGSALVLDGECSTTALRWDDGLVVIRDFGPAGQTDVVAMIAAVTPDQWVPTSFTVDLKSGGLFIFDSAYAGQEREQADGGVLEAAVVPGAYRVWVARPLKDRTTLVRLVGASQRNVERGMTGILVR